MKNDKSVELHIKGFSMQELESILSANIVDQIKSQVAIGRDEKITAEVRISPDVKSVGSKFKPIQECYYVDRDNPTWRTWVDRTGRLRLVTVEYTKSLNKNAICIEANREENFFTCKRNGRKIKTDSYPMTVAGLKDFFKSKLNIETDIPDRAIKRFIKESKTK